MFSNNNFLQEITSVLSLSNLFITLIFPLFASSLLIFQAPGKYERRCKLSFVWTFISDLLRKICFGETSQRYDMTHIAHCLPFVHKRRKRRREIKTPDSCSHFLSLSPLQFSIPLSRCDDIQLSYLDNNSDFFQ